MTKFLNATTISVVGGKPRAHFPATRKCELACILRGLSKCGLLGPLRHTIPASSKCSTKGHTSVENIVHIISQCYGVISWSYGALTYLLTPMCASARKVASAMLAELSCSATTFLASDMFLLFPSAASRCRMQTKKSATETNLVCRRLRGAESSTYHGSFKTYSEDGAWQGLCGRTVGGSEASRLTSVQGRILKRWQRWGRGMLTTTHAIVIGHKPRISSLPGRSDTSSFGRPGGIFQPKN